MKQKKLEKGYPVLIRFHYKSVFHPIENIKQFCRDIQRSVQRIRRGYSDYDATDLDVWFINTVPFMLETLLKINAQSKSYPFVIEWEIFEKHKEEIGCSFDDFNPFYDERSEALHKQIDDEAREQWRGILKEMIFLFRESDDYFAQRRNPYENDPTDERYFAAERELEEYREDCRNRAFALFVKYFKNLWE